MTGLIDVLYPLDEGARLTGAWLDARSGATPIADRCLVAHFVELPDGAQGETESRFVSQHLGLAAAGIHGVQMDGSPWLLVLQSAPRDDVESWRPFTIMSEEWLRLLELTVGWRSIHVGDWIPREILRPYMFAGLDSDDLLDWSLRDAIGGLIGDLVGYDVQRFAHARLVRCAFKDEDHDCTGDVLGDVMVWWTASVGQRDAPCVSETSLLRRPPRGTSTASPPACAQSPCSQ